MSVNIRRMLVDALKPRETSIVELAQVLCSIEGVEEVDISVSEADANTETIKLTIKGPHVRYEGVSKALDESNVLIKGVDEISVIKSEGP